MIGLGGWGRGGAAQDWPAPEETATARHRVTDREGDKKQSGKPRGKQWETERQTERSRQKQRRQRQRERKRLTGGEPEEGNKPKPNPLRLGPGRRCRRGWEASTAGRAAQGDGVGESHLLCEAPGSLYRGSGSGRQAAGGF